MFGRLALVRIDTGVVFDVVLRCGFRLPGREVVGTLAAYFILTTLVSIVAFRELPAALAVVAADLNREMLAVADQRCVALGLRVRFIESPAHPLDVPDESFEAIVCQEGFRFSEPFAACRTRCARDTARAHRPAPSGLWVGAAIGKRASPSSAGVT